MTTITHKAPLIRSHLPVENIPWDVIVSDCDAAENVPPFIPGEFTGDSVTTVPLLNRRDLEPWAAKYRTLVLEMAKSLYYWADNYTYEDVAQGCWFNRYRHTGKAEWHTHTGYTDLVVVWYLRADPSMGRYLCKYNDVTIPVDVSTGDVIMFPGTLLHATEPNMSHEERFIMANNLCMTRHTTMRLIDMNTSTRGMDVIYNKRQQGIYERLLA